jgi:hypothetical protein
MTNFSKLIRCIVTGAATLCALAAQATTVSGTVNSDGYYLYNFNVASAETMTFKLVPGTPGTLFDPMLSLFDGAGKFMLAVDDQMDASQTIINFSPTMTQTLGAGNYTMLISSTSQAIAIAIDQGATAVPGFTDGVNFGTFYAGGNGTLGNTLYYLDNALITPPGGIWTMEITSASDVNSVPEPASLALMGLALAGLMASRRTTRS